MYLITDQQREESIYGSIAVHVAAQQHIYDNYLRISTLRVVKKSARATCRGTALLRRLTFSEAENLAFSMQLAGLKCGKRALGLLGMSSADRLRILNSLATKRGKIGGCQVEAHICVTPQLLILGQFLSKSLVFQRSLIGSESSLCCISSPPH